MDASSANAPLPPGTRLGRYEIVRMLSFGGMGELYLAKTAGIEGFEKEFALKRILAQFASDPSFEHMLLDEARLMASLQHPNIVQVFDVDRVGGLTFFTMEYVHGENLRSLLKEAARQKRGLSRTNALYIVMNVAAGLHYAHEKRRPDGLSLGLVHRDVCPNNIMLSHDGGVKLVDFGVAMAIARSAKTTPGAIKGNVRYMSPEQSVGEPLDRRSDVFSLGIVLFELTTGTRFIREKDDYAAVQKVLNEPIPRPSERVSDYPRELEQIVVKALAKNPADRFPTAQHFQLALEEFVREHKLPASSVNLARTMNELYAVGAPPSVARTGRTPLGDEIRPFTDDTVLRPRFRRWPFGVLAIAFAMAVVAGSFLLWRARAEPGAKVVASQPQPVTDPAPFVASTEKEKKSQRPSVVPVLEAPSAEHQVVPTAAPARPRRKAPSVAPESGGSAVLDWNLDSPLPPM